MPTQLVDEPETGRGAARGRRPTAKGPAPTHSSGPWRRHSSTRLLGHTPQPTLYKSRGRRFSAASDSRNKVMQKFTTLTGIAAHLPMINVDTDMIIPKQYLKTIKRTGLGKGLFAELRYDEKGKPHPDFVLHKPPYHQAKILITGENFGCGSSPRARALGAARFRHPLHHRAVLRRHLLQQLLQERHPAHHAAAGGDRQADRRRLARRQRHHHRRPRRRRRSEGPTAA